MRMPHAVKVIVEELARETEAEMKRRAPRGKTGELRESIKTIPLSLTATEIAYAVGPDVPYLPYVVRGTRPHTIYPRVAQALRWIDEHSGEVRFAKVVHHPGTRPNPFIEQTADYIRSRAEEVAYRVFESIFS